MKNLIQTLEKEKVSSLRGYSNGLNKSNENTYSLVLHVRNLSKEAYYPTDYFTFIILIISMSARTNLVLKSVQKYFAKHLNFVTRSELFLKSYRSRGGVLINILRAIFLRF